MVGNPILPPTAEKYQPETDYTDASPGGLSFSRIYRSNRGLDPARASGPLSKTWTNNHSLALTVFTSSTSGTSTATLDPMGNRIAEQINDAGGAIAWRTVRSINQINRLASQTDGPNQSASFGYDANGERIARTNALNQSTRVALDPLRRIAAITDAANATASLSYNAQDEVTQARDFKGVSTAYARDALGNATAETSPDIGNAGIDYDALGLPRTIQDALGRATTIERDLIGRPTRITHTQTGLPTQVTTLAYAPGPSSSGVLVRIDDPSGSTEYTRDLFGRVTAKRQSLISGLIQTVGYQYAANGLLSAITYPNGKVLVHRHDATGRLVQMDWDGSPLVTNLSWNPLGQPTGWRWAFVTPGTSPGLVATRTYDTAGRPDLFEFGRVTHDGAGRITSIVQSLSKPADSDPTHTGVSTALQIFNVGYDPVGRISRFTTTGDVADYSYDPNGNRTSSSRSFIRPGLPTQVTTRSFMVEAGSNRIGGFTQTQTGASTSTTSVAYQTNARGDLIGDGLRRYSFDAQGRLAAVTTGASDTAPTTRYAHNALGQRVFKTEPIYAPMQGEPSTTSSPGFMQSLLAFFGQTLSASTLTDAERLGFAFVYDEDGSLIAETGTGGANSTGSLQHVHLPTVGGAMPIALISNGQLYAVQADHLNTPRKLVNTDGLAVWQWKYSGFGEDQPTTLATRFADPEKTPNAGTVSISVPNYNLRYAGQYFDVESGLNYNGWRSYDARGGFYTQNDPIGLGSGFNRKSYVFGNPLRYTDPDGLFALLPPMLMPPTAATPPISGVPPSIDPENPYRGGAPASPGLTIPSYTVPGMIARGCRAVSDWMLSQGNRRPPGVPEHWTESPSRDGKGSKWVDPANPKGGDYVRVRGDGTLTQVKGGRALDVNGNPAPGLSSPEAHFPRDQWEFRP
ncbi:MAG: hypothetical protein KJ901_24505 [Gammaproteobacteria bacterium]|nr:hypothetical protein [Gammaproteobacteria bacterium]